MLSNANRHRRLVLWLSVLMVALLNPLASETSLAVEEQPHDKSVKAPSVKEDSKGKNTETRAEKSADGAEASAKNAAPERKAESQKEAANTEPEQPDGASPSEASKEAEPTSDETEDEPRRAQKIAPKTFRIEHDGTGTIYWFAIEDTIDLGLAPFVERVVAQAKEDANAVAIVSEIHTPGGRVDAAVRIRDALLESPVPTVAFINSEAISAGALIAMAHDYVVIDSAGTIGAATPIQMGSGGGAEAVGEKMVSYVRGVFRATAEAKGRDPIVAAAMVDADIHVSGLAPKGKLLTATANEALEWGIVDKLNDDEPAMLKAAGLEGPTIKRMTTNWAELIARFLTHPMVSSLLMSLGFLGLMMEFYSPGFGFVGGVGIACLLLFFFGHYTVSLAGFEEVALFVLGLVFIVLELFVTPGFGLLGVLGLLGVVTSLVMALVALPFEVSFDSGELAGAVGQVIGVLGGTLMLGLFLMTRLVGSGPFQRLVLAHEVQGKAVGFGAGSGGVGSEGDEGPAVGMRGIACTELRPSGKVLIDGRQYDAVTKGEVISRDTPVEVRGSRHANLIVFAVADESGEVNDD